MKKFGSILLTLVLVLSTSMAMAQLSKQEAKEWKNRAKEYKKNPEQLKNLVEENSSLKGQVSSTKGQVSSLQSRIADKDARINELQDEINKLKADVSNANAARRQLEEQMASAPAKPSGDWDKGVVFKVQIGAFRNKDLETYFDSGAEIFGGFKDEEGTQRITIGNFRDYWVADKFKKYLREMGVTDAWIVSYKDNQRVPLKDVLEGVTKEESSSD